MDASGDFVLSWGEADGGGYGITARRFTAEGVARDPVEFRVNTHTSHDQARAAVAMDTAGDFVVAWESGQQDGDGYGVYAQHFSADRGRVGREFRVNSQSAGQQRQPATAMDSDGDFVVVWHGEGLGDSYGVYARVFLGPGCYGEPLDAGWSNVAPGDWQDCVSYSSISGHHFTVEPGATLVMTAPNTGLGPETVIQAGAEFKAGP